MTVDRAVAALNKALGALNQAVGALNRRLPPYIGSVAVQGGSRLIRVFCRVSFRPPCLELPPYSEHLI